MQLSQKESPFVRKDSILLSDDQMYAAAMSGKKEQGSGKSTRLSQDGIGAVRVKIVTPQMNGTRTQKCFRGTMEVCVVSRIEARLLIHHKRFFKDLRLTNDGILSTKYFPISSV